MVTSITFGMAAKAVGGFLRAYWKQTLVVLVLLMLWWKWHSMSSTIDKLEQQKTLLTQQNTDLRVTNQQLNTLADATQRSLERIDQLADSISADFDELKRENDASQQRFRAQLNSIRTQPAPQTNQESVDYLIRTSKELRSDAP